MRYSCTKCDATLQTAAPRAETLPCPACGGQLAAEADVYHLRTDRDPTRRYDLDELKARLQVEKDAVAALARAPAGRSAEQIWFVGVQGRQVGPLTRAGLEGLRTRGQLAAATLVWREGFPSWVAAEAVPELRGLVGLREMLPALPFSADERPKSPAPQPPAPPIDDKHLPEAEPLLEAELEPDIIPERDEPTTPGAPAPLVDPDATASFDFVEPPPAAPAAAIKETPPAPAPPAAAAADQELGAPAERDAITKVARAAPAEVQKRLPDEPTLPPDPLPAEPKAHLTLDEIGDEPTLQYAAIPLPDTAILTPEALALVAATPVAEAAREEPAEPAPPPPAERTRPDAVMPAAPPAEVAALVAGPARPAPKRGYRAAGVHNHNKGRGRGPRTIPPPLPQLKAPVTPREPRAPTPPPSAPEGRHAAPPEQPLPPLELHAFGPRPAPPNVSRKIAAALAVIAAIAALLMLLRSDPAPAPAVAVPAEGR